MMRLWNRNLQLLAVLLVPILVGCGEKGEGFAQSESGPRLAVLSPGLCEVLRDLGAGDAIVARHDYDRFTDPSVPAAGDQGAIDYEALLGVGPTHVVVEARAGGVPARLEEIAGRSGWEVVVVPMLSAQDIRDSIARMGALSGSGEGVIAELERAFDEAFARSEHVALLGRTLLLVESSPAGAVGPGSLHYELVERLGARPVPSEGAAFMRLSHEDVAKLDPDSIVVFTGGGASGGVDAALGGLARLDLRARREGRVVVVDDPKALLQGTCAIDWAMDLRAWCARGSGPK